MARDLENRLLRERNEALLAELQKSQEMLRQAHCLARIGIWRWDRDADTIEWSDELWRIAGRDPGAEQLSFARLGDFFSPPSMEAPAAGDGHGPAGRDAPTNWSWKCCGRTGTYVG